MRQLTQKLKNGQMQIKEVPLPVLQNGHVLVKNHYSLISPGTEASTVKAARKSYLGKAKERPQQFQQVIKTLQTQGPVTTYRAVMKKLDAHSPLGYSSAGEVVDVATDVTDFTVGDRVACAGLSACHAEVVCIPRNLCVKLKSDADLKQAAYNSLGAIALQGIRQANLQIGETCAVIGLGLIGQLTSLLLKVSGIKVIGVDINSSAVKMAHKNSCHLAIDRNALGIRETIFQFTEGIGCDAAIITAASTSHDPINFAGSISRKKGTIIVVGAVPTGFDREPHYYQKELTVKMSCSYGPGRYDPIYEQKGIDYPSGYVRWTERRNMQAFQDLLANHVIDLNYLTSHVYKLEQASEAYELILSKSETVMGLLIEFESEKSLQREKLNLKQYSPKQNRLPIQIGFIGAGSYAQNYLLPILKKIKDVSLKGVMTATGTGARSVADRFGFDFCTDQDKDIFNDSEINTIFIATRHDSHAELVQKAIEAGKNVFVEKPLCMKEEELHQIIKKLKRPDTSKENKLNPNHPILMVGYNRRFSPLGRLLKDNFQDGPMAMTYRINAGRIPADSWIQDPSFGGGRIIGEVCHFVDFLTFINGSLPISVYAKTMKDSNELNDTINISITYENGSIGSISYFANGDTSMPKERCEIYANGCVAVLDDFKNLSIYANGKRTQKRHLLQDKGQKCEIDYFIESILTDPSKIIPLEEIINTSTVTFKIIESIQKGTCIQL